MSETRLNIPLWERTKHKIARKRTKCKKIAIFAIFAGLALCFVLINCVFCNLNLAYADKNKSEEEIRAELEDVLGDTVDGLDLSGLEAFLNSLDADERAAIGIDDLKSTLKALVSGNAKDFFTQTLQVFAKSVGKYFLGFIPACITIIVICLLKNLLGGLTGDFANNSTTEVVHMVCYFAIIIVLMSGVASVTSTVTRTVDRLMTLSSAMFPALLTLLSMLGGATSVATYTPFMAALSSVIIKFVSSAIVPAFVATSVLGVVGNLSENVKLDKLTRLIKSASTWLIGIVFGLFATFLTAQGVAGGVVDKFGFNIAKFALSSYVPILGGYLSDGMDLLSASLVLTKNALGYTGVIVLICSVLFPLVKVAVFSLSVRLTAAIAEPLGDKRVASLMSGVASNAGLLVTALAGVAFLFFVMLMLLIGSCNVI